MCFLGMFVPEMFISELFISELLYKCSPLNPSVFVCAYICLNMHSFALYMSLMSMYCLMSIKYYILCLTYLNMVT